MCPDNGTFFLLQIIIVTEAQWVLENSKSQVRAHPVHNTLVFLMRVLGFSPGYSNEWLWGLTQVTCPFLFLVNLFIRTIEGLA